jgi:phage baseplate assembly protein W
MAVEVPHLSLPFRFEPDALGVLHAAVNEQDSPEDVADCVQAILMCPLGFRLELPDFGLRDQTFNTPGADIDEIQTAISLYEPRADVLIEEDPSQLIDMIDNINVKQNIITVLQAEDVTND